MKAALLASIVAFGLGPFAGVAGASPTPIIVAPPGWTLDPEQGAQIMTHATGDPKPAVEVYIPRQPGVALIASRFSTPATTPATTPASADAVRSAIDDLYGAADRAKIISTNVTVLERADHYDPDRKEVVATQSVKGDTTTISRLVIAMDAAHTTAALGECVIRDDAPMILVEACKKALLSLDPNVAARVAIALPASTVPVLEAPPEHPARPSATMSDGSRVPMPPILVPPDPPAAKDRRPFYVGAGLVVLALIFWWGKRQRDRFEKEDGRPVRKARARGTTDDDDADELHRAAKGESDE